MFAGNKKNCNKICKDICLQEIRGRRGVWAGAAAEVELVSHRHAEDGHEEDDHVEDGYVEDGYVEDGL